MTLPTSKPLLAAFAVALVALLGHVAQSDACECEGATYRTHVKRADRVALVKVTEIDGKKVSAAVLHRFKGKRHRAITFLQDDNPLCGRPYELDEVAIVFVRRGRADICDGNVWLASQLDHLRAIARASKHKLRRPALAETGRALLATLSSHIDDTTLRVHLPALAGKSFRLEEHTLAFQRKSSASAIEIDAITRVGTLTYVSGTYDREGISFALLWSEKDDELLFSSVAR